MEEMRDSGAKLNVQSTNQSVLPPRDAGATSFFNHVVQHVTSCVGALLPPQTIAASMENPLQNKTVPVREVEVPYAEIPSTSTVQDVKNHVKEFDLISYLHDITNAPVNFILREYRRFNVDLRERPHPLVLRVMVNSLLRDKMNSASHYDEYEETQARDFASMNIREDITKPSASNNNSKVPFAIPESNNNSQESSMMLKRDPLIHPKEKTVIDVEAQKQTVTDTDVDNIRPSASGSSKKVLVAIAEGNNNSQMVKRDPLMIPKEENVSDLEESVMDVDRHLVNHLCSIFPDACPTYIKQLCRGKARNNEVLADITSIILSSDDNYPKRSEASAIDVDHQLEILKELLPDADPDYLRMKCDQFEGHPDRMKRFINKAIERRNYPSMKEYLRRQQLSAQERQYKSDFNVESFIKIIPNPHEFFSDPGRVVKMDGLSTHYALVFLKNTFNKLLARTITTTFTKHKSNLYKTYKDLEKITERGHRGTRLQSIRKPVDMPNSVQNIPLLQEIAYCSHYQEIHNYLKKIKEEEDAERQQALDLGLMKTCGCCYDEEVLPREIFTCESKNCEFCKNCIVKSTEVRFGEGKLDFPCLANCSSQFSLQTLQAVLSPKLFSKIAQKKALEEVKSAGIEDLETCPFCDFATIPAEGYNIFTCMNPECMKESCRVCKEPSHIPLRCEEIEKDEDVKARVFIENKMTEALLKKCWKCGLKFFKEEGCNKMTCSCGASMCYVCGKPVTDYKHFNGNGGSRFDLCPLFSDTNTMNKENVLKAAAAAKTEIGNKELKHDPTADVEKHYKERAKKLPPPPVVNGVMADGLALFRLNHPHHHRHDHQHHRHHQHHQHHHRHH